MLKTAFLIVIFLFATCISFAQWSTNPTQNLIVGYGANPEVCSDGAGGCYVTYENSISYPTQLVLERVNRYGYKPWVSPRFIAGELEDQRFAKITEDGRGGVLIAFSDDSIPLIGGTFRIRVQRVDSSGNFLWGPTGVRVSLSETNSGDQAIVSDGQGGCIVAWKDTLDVIRMQRVDAVGTRAWGDSGVLVSATTQYIPRLVKTSSSSFVVAFGTLLKKYNLAGNASWRGQAVNVGFGTRSIIADRDGGVIVYDGTGTSSNILIVTQRVDSSGVFVWNSPYVVLDDSAIFNVLGNPISLNPAGGATFAWRKNATSAGDLRTQTIRSDGTVIFSFGGRRVSMVTSEKRPVGVLPSDLATTLFVWTDFRSPRGTYAQRFDTLARAIWDTADVLVSVPDLSYASAVTDGSGGLIAVGSRENFSIRAQQINKHGILGQVITSVEDNADNDVPDQPILYQNYPNPLNPQTTIRFQLPQATHVELTLFNVLGQNIETLASGVREAGLHSVVLQAHGLPSGTYFYRLATPQGVLIHKLIILK